MSLVALDAIPQVPLDFINADHREEARLLNELDEALAAHRARRTGPEPVLACFEALFTHTRAHFHREEEAMQRTGFPPYTIHKSEHERVLLEMAEQGQAFGEGGDAARLADYVGRAVPAWFTNHILTMDLITARFISSRGG
jgi:hemerythrin